MELTKFQTNNQEINWDLLLISPSTDLMAVVCNIDQRGMRFRGIMGTILLGIGLFIGASFLLNDINQSFLWLLPAGLIAGGAFSIFEAWIGWCAVRALGFRTKL